MAMKLSLLRSIGVAAIGVASASVLGRGLGVGGYGRYQLVANLAAQIGQVCEAGVGTAIVALRKHGITDFNTALSVVGRFFLAMTVPTLFVSCGLVYLLVDNAPWSLMAVGCVISISTLAQGLAIGVFRTIGKTRTANALMVLPPMFNLPLAATLWWTGSLTPVAALEVLACAYALMVVFAVSWLIQLLRHAPPSMEVALSERVSLGELFKVSWKSSASRISQLLIYRFDLFLLAFFVGEESLGIYVPAVFLASQLNHFGDSVGFVLYPSLARQEMNSTHAGEVCRGLMLVACVTSTVIAIASPWVLWLVWGSGYSSSVVPLMLLLPGYVFLTPAKALSAYLAVATQFEANLKASLSGLAVNTILNRLLIPGFGVVGAAIATSVALVCVSAILSFQFQRRTGLRIRDFWIPRATDVQRGLAMFTSRRKPISLIDAQ
ncbi:MATE family efflux transporter [Neorhodopirellula pilleata]|uniref:Polysaccharide biosynthesis protein n=1 Tax=Neorhodopirellula pilleata TaxID=2714738 RepID=A0A5C6A548_9BACT|nr:polysaccharide biosynthesis C-terminal domain-containing protein [Neorhodopirellula pilleata]TWT93513.1 Polysaccharide biosynthesis protein [Neorhodopirellula pilleata]